MGAGLPKALYEVMGRPLILHALDRVVHVDRVARVVVAAPPELVGRFVELCHSLAARPEVTVIAGGPDRHASVQLGLRSLTPPPPIVLVHDAARALAPTALFERVAAAVRSGHDSVVPALPICDTVRRVDAAGIATHTLDRGGLHAVQTPQGFRTGVLALAHAQPLDVSDKSVITDDAGLVERLGYRTHVVSGEPCAFKVTHPSDVPLTQLWLGAHSA